MRILALTAMYPTAANPAFGSFVRTQVEALRGVGVGVDVLVLDGPIRKLIYPKGVFQLRRRLAAGDVDLVHAHYGYVGMVARTQWKVPVVVTFHGDDLLGTVDESGRRTRPSELVVAGGKALTGMVDATIVQSEEMARASWSSRTFVVPHEVDFELFRPLERAECRAELGLDPDRPYVLFAADPGIPVKRYPLARAAVDQLVAEGVDAELVVVHREPQPRLVQYMNACNALILTSWQEGSPNVVKQAMACNVPVVSTDVGDVRQLMGGTDGCHVCAADPSELAKALVDVFERNRPTAGRDAVAHLTCDLVAARLIEVYETVLREGRRYR
jgi:glycosyltransferase involved in cell wall biosynthesis